VALLLIGPPADCITQGEYLSTSESEKAVRKDIDHIFSLDLGYALTGLTNSGWGLGVSYEQKMLDFLSIKGGFGHMTFLTSHEDVYCTSVSISLSANYYPLRDGLDKLYVGLGSNGDFMNYFGSGDVPDNPEDIIISLTSVLGWKFRVFQYLMIDLHSGYKLIIQNAENYRGIEGYIDRKLFAGIEFGINFKIVLP
jgi:hypothetical protein